MTRIVLSNLLNLTKYLLLLLNSEHLLLERKSKPFHLENATSWTHGFLYDNFNKKV